MVIAMFLMNGFNVCHDNRATSPESEGINSETNSTGELQNNPPEGWFANLFDYTEETEQLQSDVEEVIENTEQSVDDPAPCTEKNTPSVAIEDIEKTEASLSEIFSGWIYQLKTDPETFRGPIEAFIKNHQSVSRSQSALISAMHCFGKNVGPSAIGFRKGNLSSIPVQPTSVARRTTYLGGRKSQHTGRPPKASGTAGMTSDHDYSNSKRKPNKPVWSALPKRLKVAAPHSLQACVDTSRMTKK